MATVSTSTQTGVARQERQVIIAASVGTAFEWYNFYLYVTLAPFFATHFFPPGNDMAALLSAFATYAVAFLVRPFGAIIFGRIGDSKGRKFTFLLTVFLMGLATFAVGLLPTFEGTQLPLVGWVDGIGWFAPLLLLFLRLIQGLALGGEYGGAAVYVAEHARPRKRGYATSWIQTTATLGFLLALFVIGASRFYLFDAESFGEWGWRIPFLISLLPLIFSIYIRLKLSESPIWHKLNEQGGGSRRPIIDSFFKRPNNKWVLLALLGGTAGQAVIWYTGHFYALLFLTVTLKVDVVVAYAMVGLSLLVATPFFVFFGWISDKIGRLGIILAGCLVAALTYIPLFEQLARSVNRDLVAFQERNQITLTTDTSNCSLHIFVGPWSTFTACDLAKDFLVKAGLSFETVHRLDADNELQIGPTTLTSFNKKQWTETFAALGYPTKAELPNIEWFKSIGILTILLIYVAAVSGPIAAFLVEMFPTNIRYTSISLPFDIGSGWFGGMLPLLATAITVWTGNIYAGLYYPIAVALMTVLFGLYFLTETRNIDDTVSGEVDERATTTGD